MKFISKIIFVLAIITGPMAHARFGGDGVFCDLSITYSLSRSETKLDGQSTQQTTDVQTTLYDIKLGYIFPISWYLGVIHSSRSDNVLYHHEDYGTSNGLSVGYLSYTGPYFMIHYLFQSSKAEYSRGSGTQVDFGYKFEANNHWVFGIEVSHRALQYQRSDRNSALEYFNATETFPMASVGYLF